MEMPMVSRKKPPSLLRPSRRASRSGMVCGVGARVRLQWAILLFVVAFAALSLANPATSTAREPLKIGFVLGLTGPGAPDESDIWDGALLAVEEINASGDEALPHIDMTAFDTQNQPIMARSAAKEAVASGAHLLLAPSYSSQALEVARVAMESGIPLISVIATHPDIVATGDYIFRVCFDDNDQARTMAAFARHDLGAATAAVLTDLTSAYSMAMSDVFRERFTALGGRVVQEIEYKMRQRDFGEVARQAAQAHAEVLFMPGYWVDTPALLKALQDERVESIPLGGDGWGSSRFEELRGAYPRRGYYTDHWAPFMKDAASQQFTQAYARRFGRLPVAGAALAYDAVQAAARSTVMAGSTQLAALRQALASLHDFPAVTGAIHFNAQGETQKSVHIMELRDGKADLVKTVDAEGPN
jgi:branched-chain amino acid transport system substrate-binding protein